MLILIPITTGIYIIYDKIKKYNSYKYINDFEAEHKYELNDNIELQNENKLIEKIENNWCKKHHWVG
jgi:amino acid permease